MRRMLRFGGAMVGLAGFGCMPRVDGGFSNGAEEGGSGFGSSSSGETGDSASAEGSTPVEASSSGEAQGQCAPIDPEAVFTARVEACLDAECADTDPDFWFPQLSEPSAAEVTVDFSCVVKSFEALGEGGNRWVMSDCTGDGVPASRTVMFELEAAMLPAFDVGDDVLVDVFRSYGDWIYVETRAWALRSSEGELAVLFSEDGDLPPESFTAPFALRATPQPCLERLADGREGPMELEVSLGDEDIVVTSGNSARVAGSLVVVESSSYATDMRGAFGGWTRLEFLIVHRSSG